MKFDYKTILILASIMVAVNLIANAITPMLPPPMGTKE